MSKYSGRLTILDSEGSMVHERELTADEMIDCLLHKNDGKFVVVPPVVIDSLAETASGFNLDGPVRKNGRVKPTVTRNGRKAKECCGSLGARHMKYCTGELVQKGAPAKSDRYVSIPTSKLDSGRLLDEEEFSTVKEMTERFKNTMQIRSELGDDCTFQQINWAVMHASYDAYKQYAEDRAV